MKKTHKRLVDEERIKDPWFEGTSAASITCLEMIETNKIYRPISFGCKILDAAFCGGVKRSGITEISGEAGTGKTQICLQLLLNAVSAIEQGGLGGSAIFLSCGEGSFPSNRLSQMATLRCLPASVLDRIILFSIHNIEDQYEVITEQLSSALSNLEANLVIIDSISALFRSDQGKNNMDYMSRSRTLFKMAQAMKKLSSIHNAAFVVVNQVTASFDDGIYGESVPAMGLAWANCVNTRFFLKRERGSELGKDFREIIVELSPYMPPISVPFSVTADGVNGLSV